MTEIARTFPVHLAVVLWLVLERLPVCRGNESAASVTSPRIWTLSCVFWKACVFWSYRLFSKNCRVPTWFLLPPGNLKQCNLLHYALWYSHRSQPLLMTSFGEHFTVLCGLFVMWAAVFWQSLGSAAGCLLPRGGWEMPWGQRVPFPVVQVPAGGRTGCGAETAQATVAGAAENVGGVGEQLFGEKRPCWKAVMFFRVRVSNVICLLEVIFWSESYKLNFPRIIFRLC